MILRYIDPLHNLIKFINANSISYTRSRINKHKSSLTGAKARPKLLVDISVFYQRDAGTGIQRLVRSVLSYLQTSPPAKFDVHPVSATLEDPYCYIDKNNLESTEKITVNPGDIFLGLDFSPFILPSRLQQLKEWKKSGLAFHFIIYDILPLKSPQWFSPRLVTAFRRWIKAIAILADSAMCISRSVETEFSEWLEDHYRIDRDTIPVCTIPLGWDFSSVKHSTGITDTEKELFDQIVRETSVLMVGTLEPRKGHIQVIKAFEHLWENGNNYNLVIVGRPGWKTESLQDLIRSHPLFNKRLFWFDNSSDELLLKLYQSCNNLIIASLAEGYGLAVQEALGHGIRVLARDLPVFHQPMYGGVEYFSTKDPGTLAGIVDAWLKTGSSGTSLIAQGNLPSWSDTCAAIIDRLESISHKNTARTVDHPPVSHANGRKDYLQSNYSTGGRDAQ